jgi:hypothetical protein
MDREVHGKDTMHEEMRREIEHGKERERVLERAAEAAAAKADQCVQLQKNLERVLASERQKVEEQRREVENKSRFLEEHKNENNNLHAEIEHFTEVNATLQSELGKYKQEAGEAGGMKGELLETVADLTAKLTVQEEQAGEVRKEMVQSLNDLEKISQQRDDAFRAMEDAVAMSAQSMVEQQALESKNQQQRAQIGSLQQSKTLLQKAMLEQLSSARQQLTIEQERRQTTEGENLRLRASFDQRKGAGNKHVGESASSRFQPPQQKPIETVAQYLSNMETAQVVSNTASAEEEISRAAAALDRSPGSRAASAWPGTAPSLMDLAAQ